MNITNNIGKIAPALIDESILKEIRKIPVMPITKSRFHEELDKLLASIISFFNKNGIYIIGIFLVISYLWYYHKEYKRSQKEKSEKNENFENNNLDNRIFVDNLPEIQNNKSQNGKKYNKQTYNYKGQVIRKPLSTNTQYESTIIRGCDSFEKDIIYSEEEFIDDNYYTYHDYE